MIDAGSPGRISINKKMTSEATNRVMTKAKKRFARKIDI
jgi:hypothetical protein